MTDDDKISSHVPLKPAPVVVLVHPDNYIEVFGNVDCKIILLPDAGQGRGELLAEEWAELQMPQRHRDIFYLGNLKAAKACRKLTPRMLWGAEIDREFLRVLKQLEGAA